MSNIFVPLLKPEVELNTVFAAVLIAVTCNMVDDGDALPLCYLTIQMQ
jgi:hypothetical protein